MDHLTTDEILSFVTFHTLTEENMKLAAKVNSHLLSCDECLEKVRHCQTLPDSNRNNLPIPGPELNREGGIGGESAGAEVPSDGGR